MSVLTRTTFDTTYNSSGSGAFLDNTSQSITASIIRQFAKDIEDSVGFLSNTNTWTGLNTYGSTNTAAVVDASIGTIKSYFITADNSVFHISGFFQAEQTISGTNSIQGVEGYTKVSHPSGSLTLAIGTIGNIEMASTGTLAIARSLQAGGNTSAAGTITEWDGLYVSFANSGGATITAAYGVYIDTFPSGVTNKWGIFVADSAAKNKVRGGMSMPDLPTSSSGLSSGDFWVNSNVVTRVP